MHYECLKGATTRSDNASFTPMIEPGCTYVYMSTHGGEVRMSISEWSFFFFFLHRLQKLASSNISWCVVNTTTP